MIVIGTDTHKRAHARVTIFARSGQRAGKLIAPARRDGPVELLDCRRGSEEECIWALEDCRQVCGSLERFVVASGERVLRASPKLPNEGRRGQLGGGQSDPIDALAIARAALREGPETPPTAHLDTDALQLKLLLDHREDLVKARTEDQQRLRWHQCDLRLELDIPAGVLDCIVWLGRVDRKLSRAEQGFRMHNTRELVVGLRRRARGAAGLEREIAAKAKEQPSSCSSCGAVTAAKLLAETANVWRRLSDSKFVRLAGVAPIAASSGNRQLDRALCRLAVTQGQVRELACEFLARKQAERKSRMEVQHRLKCHLARRVWRPLIDSEIDRSMQTVDTQRGSSMPQSAAATLT